jgi:hypothetical protein
VQRLRSGGDDELACIQALTTFSAASPISHHRDDVRPIASSFIPPITG